MTNPGEEVFPPSSPSLLTIADTVLTDTAEPSDTAESDGECSQAVETLVTKRLQEDQEQGKKKPIRICSLPGGGIKGIISAMFLMKLEQITGKHPTELFDIFIGTSTGALICSILNIPSVEGSLHPWKYTAKDLLDVYIKEASTTFESSMWRKVSTMNGIYGPMYYTRNRDEKLKAWLGDVSLKDTLCDVIITSYELCTHSPVFFKSRKARLDPQDNFLLTDVNKAATAAPTIWPPHQIGERIFIDALYGKDPSLFGITEALKHYNADLGNILVLTLGTGYTRKKTDPGKVVTSGHTFLIEVFSNMINANTMNVPYMITELFQEGSKILKLDVALAEEHMGICDVSKKNLDYLIRTTQQYIAENEDEIREFAGRLLGHSHFCESDCWNNNPLGKAEHIKIDTNVFLDTSVVLNELLVEKVHEEDPALIVEESIDVFHTVLEEENNTDVPYKIAVSLEEALC
jgi:patatin-like phospholipase/acyl hydrolase